MSWLSPESRPGYNYTPLARRVCILGRVRRIQIHIDESLDAAAEAEAARRGQSKAALIRAALAHELTPQTPREPDPWAAMTGWLEDGPVPDLDAVVYDRKR